MHVAAEGLIAVGLLAGGLAASRAAGLPLPFGRAWLAATTASRAAAAPQVRVDIITAAGGRAVLVSSEGHAVLIDGGAGPTGEAVVARLHALGLAGLQAAYMTRGNTSAAAGLIAVMDEVPVQRLYDLVPGNSCPAHQGVLADARAHNVPVGTAQRGSSLRIGPAQVQVLWPAAELGGAQSVGASSPGLVRLVDGQVRMLFADGLPVSELPSIERLASEMGAQVLEVPGGGSSGSLPAALLSEVAPRLALLEPSSSGPAPSVLGELAAAHILGVDVGRSSDLYLETDGRGLTLGLDAGEPGVAPSSAESPPPATGPCA